MIVDQSLLGMTPTERRAIYCEMRRVLAALLAVDYGADIGWRCASRHCEAAT